MTVGIVIWQCSEHSEHRGWRDESNPSEQMRRGTCDKCLARTAFEREVIVSGEEYRPPLRDAASTQTSVHVNVTDRELVELAAREFHDRLRPTDEAPPLAFAAWAAANRLRVPGIPASSDPPTLDSFKRLGRACRDWLN